MPGVATYLNLDKLISFLKSEFLYLQNYMIDVRIKQDNIYIYMHIFTVFDT